MHFITEEELLWIQNVIKLDVFQVLSSPDVN